MLYYNSSCTDPAFNLALEECLLDICPPGECIFSLWQSKSAVLIGRYQNTMNQIHPEFIRQNKISVVRRITGGGAVYQDLGNINYSFIRKGPNLNRDFQFMTRPIINALSGLGIRSEFSSRNDITVNGYKISGNAMHISGDTILHHGTLLFDTDFSMMKNSLKVGKEKLAAKGVSSVTGCVANLTGFLPEPITLREFCERLFQSVLSEETDNRPFAMTRSDRERVKALAASKYNTWDWNYGESPDYNLFFSRRLACGIVEIYIKIDKKKWIEKIRILGDFFCPEDITDVERQLTDVPFDPISVGEKLRSIDLSKYLAGIRADEITELLFQKNSGDNS